MTPERAVEAAFLGEQGPRTEKHGHVAVVAARMHGAGVA
jgi:hypothetical protein